MADVVWNNVSGGDWVVGSNWQGGLPPSATSNALLNSFPAGRSYTVSLNNATTVAALAIEASALLNISAPGQADTVTGSAMNAGAFALDGTGLGGSSVTIGNMLTNSGTMTIGNSGLTTLASLRAGSFAQNGTVSIVSNDTNAPDALLAVAGAFTQSAGQTDDRGTLTAQAVTLAGGVFEGDGAVSAAMVNSGGILQPGDAGAGVLAINGSYTQSGSGILSINLSGAGQSTGVAVDGSVSLQGGTLSVTAPVGFSFAAGQAYTVLSYAANALSGNFAQIQYGTATGTNSVAVGNGLYLTAKYDNSQGSLYGSVSLVVTSAPELPPLVTVPTHLLLQGGTVGAVNGISVATPITENVTVSIGVQAGVLNLGSSAGVQVSGANSAALSLSGGVAAVNAALQSLTDKETGVSTDTMQVTLTAQDGQTANEQIAADIMPQPATIVGSGSNMIVLGVSEDAWQGNAQFTVSVDGHQIGGVQTVTASHAAGQSQLFDIEGNFGAGAHAVSVTFLNDAWAGAGKDRNLYVDTIGESGWNAAVNIPLVHDGSAAIGVADAGLLAAAPTIMGAGANSLTVNLSEDAWAGNACFTISIDGHAAGGVQTVTASHAAGQIQTFIVEGAISAGNHVISIDFLNDAWGGSSATDRNLYVDSFSENGQTYVVNTPIVHTGATSFDAAPITAASISANPAMAILTASAGNATLVGMNVSTNFDFSAGLSGNDVIANFGSADLLTLKASQFSGWAAVQTDLQQTAAGAMIRLDATHAITLQGVAVGNLSTSNVVFN